jgi:multidrug efflux pump subunit AcrA (membrane-fusion protein)
VKVEIGIRNSQHAEVKSGSLQPGDEVVIGARRPPQATPPATPLGSTPRRF